ncbi:CocE/NonD family hydrolase [Cohnella caldifontis]|uniref:CocE/NonD family hydrolase n=1 Tax=Cohnella caldifontis TaxID=3027471 RepID=UPI0023EC51C4|nr:CocE/NonD family hydrolase [Cohnella sp. YIM B05605]
MSEFSGYTRRSKYVEGYGSVKLAVDLYFPTRADGSEAGALPAVLLAGRFHRRQAFEMYRDVIETLLRNGYAYLVLETRGFGASFGYSQGFCEPTDGEDVKAVIEWAAEQRWCDGHVGMMGLSNMGLIQEAAAARRPPHLRAITPVVCNSDFYYQNYPNGVSALPVTRSFVPPPEAMGAPVDEDPAPNFPLAAAAMKDHERNRSFAGYQFTENMFRDTVNPRFGFAPNLVIPPCEYTEEIKASGVAVYQIAGWFDPGCGGQLITQADWGGHILVGPWDHGSSKDGETAFPNGKVDMAREHLRWFDYALKGIDNGFAAEPAVRYYTLNAPAGKEWRQSSAWPPENAERIAWFFGPGPSGTVRSANDGCLTAEPIDSPHVDRYKTDFEIEVFDPRRGRMNRYLPEDLTAKLDEKGLTYTSAPLERDLEVTGHPVMELWVTSTAEDGNFLAYLEEVRADGTSRLVTEGFMRASHRKESANGVWDRMGLPYHRSLERDYAPLSDREPAKLAFILEAVSYVYTRGSRIRVTVTNAEKGVQQPEGIRADDPPVVRIHCGGDTPSSVTLPVVGNG